MKHLTSPFIALASTLLLSFNAYAASTVATLEGTWGGQSLVPRSAFYAQYHDRGYDRVVVYIGSSPRMCDDWRALRLRSDLAVLEMTIAGVGEAGRYPVASTMMSTKPEPGEAKAIFARLDDRCRVIRDNMIDGYSTSGALTLAGPAGGSTLRGTFAISFGLNGDVVRGSFNAERCDLAYEPSLPEMTCRR